MAGPLTPSGAGIPRAHDAPRGTGTFVRLARSALALVARPPQVAVADPAWRGSLGWPAVAAGLRLLAIVLGETLDWLVILGTLALFGAAAARGLTFMPAAGFIANRAGLLSFEQAAFGLGAAAFVRRLLGGRALPGAPLWGLAAIGTVCLLALAHTTDVFATRDEVFFLVAVAVLVLALLVCLDERRKTYGFVAGLAAVAVGEALVGLGQYTHGAATPAYWLSQAFAGLIHTRVYGTLGSPNVLAGFLLLGIAATAILTVSARGLWRLVPAAALVVQVAALALTYSRGGYIGLAVWGLVAAGLLWPVRRRAWPVFALVAIVAGVALARVPAVGLRAQSIAPAQEDTATSRMFIWRAALRMWRSHRLWGTGLGTFNAAYSPYRPQGVLETYAMLPVPGSAHDDYLQVLAETGEAGMGLLLAALLWGLWRAGVRYVRGDADTRIWLGMWGATLAGIGTISVVDENLFVVTNVVTLFALGAAVAAHVGPGERPRVHLGKRLLVAPLAALLIALPPLLPVPARAAALHRQATAEVHAGAYVQAVRTFQAAMAADPTDPVVPAYLGDLLGDLYDRRIDNPMGPWQTMRQQAEALYLQAARLNPWYAYPHAQLGRLYKREERYDAAAAALREAIRLDPYTPQYRLWLGEALLAGGDRAGARAQLREAARLYPVELLVIEHHEGRGPRYAAAMAQLARIQQMLAAVDK
jgi:O-antigen ligase